MLRFQYPNRHASVISLLVISTIKPRVDVYSFNLTLVDLAPANSSPCRSCSVDTFKY